MSADSFSWLALTATIAACCFVDGGLLLLATWLTSDFTAGLWAFLVVGGPFTIFMARPTYAWFKSAFGKRAAASL
jgi:hypothetical protein